MTQPTAENLRDQKQYELIPGVRGAYLFNGHRAAEFCHCGAHWFSEGTFTRGGTSECYACHAQPWPAPAATHGAHVSSNGPRLALDGAGRWTSGVCSVCFHPVRVSGAVRPDFQEGICGSCHHQWPAFDTLKRAADYYAPRKVDCGVLLDDLPRFCPPRFPAADITAPQDHSYLTPLLCSHPLNVARAMRARRIEFPI